MMNTQEGLNRRDLLRSSSAAVFTIIAPELVRGSQANSAVSVGLVGCGGRGTHDTGYVAKDTRARVTALCDLYGEQIDATATKLNLDHPKSYTDFEKLLGDSSIDAVIIATPPFEHPRMLEAAVESQKHIYCEKPAGVDFEGCQRVMRASKKLDPKKNLTFGFQQRYGPVYLEAFKRYQEGQIGELSAARAFWISGDPFHLKQYPDPSTAKIRNWFAYRELSGDIIVEQDCHNLDVLHWFLDAKPISAVGHGGRKVRKNMDILDNLSLTYVFPNELNVAFEANQLTPAGFGRVGEEFTGTKGTIEVSRQRMIHHVDPKTHEEMHSAGDITNDSLQAFLTRIQSGMVENVGERSAVSTMFALLGRSAIYTGKEVTWKSEFGDV